MIRQAQAEDFAALNASLEAAARILGLLAAYGLQQSFVRFWCAEENGERCAMIALLDGAATVAAMTTNDIVVTDELSTFLIMQPEIQSVRTSEAAARAIAVQGGWLLEIGAIMSPGERLQAPVLAPTELSPRETYPLLTVCFDSGLPPFDAWYVDVSHRVRHGCCRIVGFREDDAPIACTMTTAECADAAIIGAVATLPAGRGKGYASSNVLTLARQLQQEGKTVYLPPKNKSAHLLYTRVGFQECGRWGNLRRADAITNKTGRV